jgi:hypothetical protein
MFSALKRGAKRIGLIFLVAALIYNGAEWFPELLGPVFAPVVRNLGITLFFFNGVDVLLRIWQPYLDSEKLGDKAETDPVGAAIVFSARLLAAVGMLLCFVISAKG